MIVAGAYVYHEMVICRVITQVLNTFVKGSWLAEIEPVIFTVVSIIC